MSGQGLTDQMMQHCVCWRGAVVVSLGFPGSEGTTINFLFSNPDIDIHLVTWKPVCQNPGGASHWAL